MKKKRFSVEQIIGVLKHAQASESSVWIPQDPRSVEPRRLGRGQVSGVLVVLRRRLMLAAYEACGQAQGGKATAPDEAWSMDFVADQLQDGTRFRSLTIVDIYTRGAVAIEAGQSLKGDDVVRVLNRVKLERGAPKVLFCDNGSEFTSQAMDLWVYRNGVKIDFSRPGKPTDNASVERCNGTFRAECLNTHWFADLKEARQLIVAWRREYNDSRPHASLDDRTPSEFASQYAASRVLAETKSCCGLTSSLVQES